MCYYQSDFNIFIVIFTSFKFIIINNKFKNLTDIYTIYNISKWEKSNTKRSLLLLFPMDK